MALLVAVELVEPFVGAVSDSCPDSPPVEVAALERLVVFLPLEAPVEALEHLCRLETELVRHFSN